MQPSFVLVVRTDPLDRATPSCLDSLDMVKDGGGGHDEDDVDGKPTTSKDTEAFVSWLEVLRIRESATDGPRASSRSTNGPLSSSRRSGRPQRPMPTTRVTQYVP